MCVVRSIWVSRCVARYLRVCVSQCVVARRRGANYTAIVNVHDVTARGAVCVHSVCFTAQVCSQCRFVPRGVCFTVWVSFIVLILLCKVSVCWFCHAWLWFMEQGACFTVQHAGMCHGAMVHDARLTAAKQKHRNGTGWNQYREQPMCNKSATSIIDKCGCAVWDSGMARTSLIIYIEICTLKKQAEVLGAISIGHTVFFPQNSLAPSNTFKLNICDITTYCNIVHAWAA